MRGVNGDRRDDHPRYGAEAHHARRRDGRPAAVPSRHFLDWLDRRSAVVVFVFVFGSVPADEALMPPRVVVASKAPMLRYMLAELLTGCFVR
jgi:hypothetical protein